MAAEAQPVGLTGGCQCGAVRYRLDAAPEWAGVCHCRMCQKAGGAPFMAFFLVREKNLVFTRGALSTFRSSAVAEEIEVERLLDLGWLVLCRLDRGRLSLCGLFLGSLDGLRGVVRRWGTLVGLLLLARDSLIGGAQEQRDTYQCRQ